MSISSDEFGRDAVEPRQLSGGAGLGLGETRDLVVVVVLQFGRAPDQRLAFAEDVAVAGDALGREMATHAVHRVGDVQVEPRREHRTLVVVRGVGQHGVAQARELGAHLRPGLERLLALAPIEGVLAGEQRLLLLADEDVDQLFDAVGVDRPVECATKALQRLGLRRAEGRHWHVELQAGRAALGQLLANPVVGDGEVGHPGHVKMGPLVPGKLGCELGLRVLK